ncbi:MAG: hypothetical protein HRU47_12420 [Verrucomicrobiales bacterium]|nr:hypothetical protein [Verrucomicrobiales bacterium]
MTIRIARNWTVHIGVLAGIVKHWIDTGPIVASRTTASSESTKPIPNATIIVAPGSIGRRVRSDYQVRLFLIAVPGLDRQVADPSGGAGCEGRGHAWTQCDTRIHVAADLKILVRTATHIRRAGKAHIAARRRQVVNNPVEVVEDRTGGDDDIRTDAFPVDIPITIVSFMGRPCACRA